MAKNKSIVYLGYEDEEITIKHAGMLNSNVNKIGGSADWPPCGEIKIPPCPLCSTARPLIVQLYAPLEQSQFHRTLYIFACLNPACSPISKSWLAVRTQHLDTTPNHQAVIISAKTKKKQNRQNAAQKISWCSGADDWGEEMDTEADVFDQQNEENGNVMVKNDNSPTRPLAVGLGGAVASSSLLGSEDEEDDDEEDESTSTENEIICGLVQLDMHSPQNAGGEDPNANCAAGVAAAGADGISGSACATATICAEIEGAETDVVLVETPQKPERDLIALLKHTPSSAALGPLTKITDITLKPYFMAVDVEARVNQQQPEHEHFSGSLSADHIRDLYQDYKQKDETAMQSPNSGGVDAVGAGEEQESYEKSLPAHGDLIFHQFISTLQQNPGQILRYSRDTFPLLIAPLTEPIPKCPNCNGETICEVQILSTLIPKLYLQQNNEPAPIEYGNVLVFTCLKSCWDTPDKMRYERVIVQAEK